MPRADRVPSTPCAVARPATVFNSHLARRALLGEAGSAALASVVISMAARPARAEAAGPNPAEIENENRLCQLAQAALAQQAIADRYNDEICDLVDIWRDESRRLDAEMVRALLDESRFPTKEECDANWRRVNAMPERKRHNELCELQEPHVTEAIRLIEEMWTIPATTDRGRDAKLQVVFGSMAPEWTPNDADADYEVKMIRRLLLEFAGPAGAVWIKQFDRANRPAGVIEEGV